MLYGTRRSRALLGDKDGVGGGRHGGPYRGGGRGLGKDVCALDPAILASDELWGDSVLVCTVWDCAA